LLAGGLTAEDEDDVLQELEQIMKVCFVCMQKLMPNTADISRLAATVAMLSLAKTLLCVKIT